MDATLSNFIIMVIASSVGGINALIGAFSACCIKSTCTHIKSGCVECDRSEKHVDNQVYAQNGPPDSNRVSKMYVNIKVMHP